MNSVETVVPRKFDHISVKSSLSNEKIDFICELMMQNNSRSILEIGVKSGGSTIKYLEFINKYLQNASLTSVDIDPKAGAQIYKYGLDMSNFKLIAGKTVEDLQHEQQLSIYDFVIFDTVHFCPGEILDYMVVQSHLAKSAIVVFDDPMIELSDYVYDENKGKTSCNSLLAHSITGTKYVMKDNLDIVAIKTDDNRLTWLDFKFMLAHKDKQLEKNKC